VDAMHTCGLAMAIQGLATGLLGAQQPALQQSGSLQAVSGVHTKKKKSSRAACQEPDGCALAGCKLTWGCTAGLR